MKDDKENDIEMNDGDSTESPADGNNMHANPESEKKPHNRKVIAAICGLALVALIGGGADYGIGHQTDADSKAESVQANDSKESGSDASAKDGSKSKEKSHTHDWSITYKTVHHDAVTHQVWHDPVTEEHYICNQCGADITSDPWGHINNSLMNGGNCGSYHSTYVTVKQGYYETVTDKAAWDEQVLVSKAWDETVTTGYKCSSCGATK